jgi:hypothetical protein
MMIRNKLAAPMIIFFHGKRTVYFSYSTTDGYGQQAACNLIRIDNCKIKVQFAGIFGEIA